MTETHTTTIGGYAIHPACELLPMMSRSALEEMAEDIRLNGQQQPIWLLDGRILDGRNRLKACEIAGVEPLIRDWHGDDPIRWVLSLNFHRRHLSDDQKSVVGARAADLLMQRALAAVRPPRTEPKDTPPASDAAETATDPKQLARVATQTAATLVNVSPRRVARGLKLLEKATPALVGAVERGEVSMGQAQKVASLTPDAQVALVEKGGPAIGDEVRRMQAESRAERPTPGRALAELDAFCAAWTCSRDLDGRYRFEGIADGKPLDVNGDSHKAVVLAAWSELQRLQADDAAPNPD